MKKLKNLGLIAILAMVFVGCSQEVVNSGVDTTVATASRAITGSNLVGTTISLKASNGKYVCSEIRTTNAPLEADRSKAVTWETFEVVDAGDGFIAFVAYNGNYVCADKNFSGTPLLANRTSIGSWEKFTWIDHGDGTASIQANVNSKYWKHSNDSTDDYTVTAGAYSMHSATIFEYDIVEGTIGEADYPTDVIPSLTNWKLTLPVDEDGNDSSGASSVDDRNTNPWEIKDDNLIDFEYKPFFQVDDGGVRFRGHCAGATTSGSKYPRTELRQRYNGGDNYWSVNDYQELVTTFKVTEVPVEKPEISMVQIHGPEDEPLRVQYHEDIGVYIIWNESNKDTANAIDYTLGQMLKVTVVVDNGDITTTIQNQSTGDSYSKTWTSNDSTGYFKVGCYTQSSIFLSEFKDGYNDEPMDAAGEMIVYSIDLTADGVKQ